MMKPKNNGQKEDIILQKKFTTYVELAAKRRRKDYFVLQYRDMEISSSLEEFDVAYAFDFECERMEGIPGWMVIENKALQEELQKLSDRNLCIFWNHVVEKESLANIARDLEIPYDTVTAIYYRTLKSIKEAMLNNE